MPTELEQLQTRVNQLQHENTELAKHNRRLVKVAAEQKDLAKAAREEFTSTDEDDLAYKALRAAKLQAANTLIYLHQHAEKESVRFGAAKYIVDFERATDPNTQEDELAKLVRSLQAPS